MFKVGIAREIITPPRGLPLVGYFNPRPNQGVLDDLQVRVLLFEQDGLIGGLVTFDLCLLDATLVSRLRRELRRRHLPGGDHLIFNASHTHTGPYTNALFGSAPDSGYLTGLVEQTIRAVARAQANLAPAELLTASIDHNPFAFNRRYWMRNGRVLTNPGKLNPDLLRPEGPVDAEVAVLAVRQQGRLTALAVNLVNHTDTIGGDLVSADWPGRLERAIQDQLGHDLPVLPLIGCAGNINHFKVTSAVAQTSYAEACRIGRGYAKIVLGLIPQLTLVARPRLAVATRVLEIPFRAIPAEELAAAQAILRRPVTAVGKHDLTSEGLATGDGPVARFFATQLVAFHRHCAGRRRRFRMLALRLGPRQVILSVPGEPFTEIGLAIKQLSPGSLSFVVSNAMGQCGYVPLPECFARGGYEILPVVGGGPREDTAARLVATARKLLQQR